MRKILVVEDSDAMRGLIASIIEEIADCEVVEVNCGFDALRALPQSQFALVITDINMPDINGFELLAFIRRNAAHKTTPVLVVSSEESERQKRRSLELGASAYLQKPFDAAELRTKVEELLTA